MKNILQKYLQNHNRPVVAGVLGLLDGVSHDAVEEDGHDLGHGGAGGGVARVAGRRHLDRVHPKNILESGIKIFRTPAASPELVGQVLQLGVLVSGGHHRDRWEWGV